MTLYTPARPLAAGRRLAPGPDCDCIITRCRPPPAAPPIGLQQTPAPNAGADHTPTHTGVCECGVCEVVVLWISRALKKINGSVGAGS